MAADNAERPRAGRANPVGVDAGAKVSIYELIRDAASQGTAVVISSSDTKELAEFLRSGRRAEWRSCGRRVEWRVTHRGSCLTHVIRRQCRCGGGLMSTGVQPRTTENPETPRPPTSLTRPPRGPSCWDRIKRQASFATSVPSTSWS